mgnify:CR=1 FL=1
MYPLLVCVPLPDTKWIRPPVVSRLSLLVILPPTNKSLAIPAPPQTTKAPFVVSVETVGTSTRTNWLSGTSRYLTRLFGPG